MYALTVTCYQQQANGQPNLNCDGLANGNSGCGVVEWSRASYGPSFDAQGGGVFAMKWDTNGIAVCKHARFMNSLVSRKFTGIPGSFYRAAVPTDIVAGQPDPTTWGMPVASLAPGDCNPISNFINHSIVFGKSLSLCSINLTRLHGYRHHILW